MTKGEIGIKSTAKPFEYPLDGETKGKSDPSTDAQNNDPISVRPNNKQPQTENSRLTSEYRRASFSDGSVTGQPERFNDTRDILPFFGEIKHNSFNEGFRYEHPRQITSNSFVNAILMPKS